MPFLLLYVGEGRKFNQPGVTNAIKQLNGITTVQPCDDCSSTHQYEEGNDFTIIRFKNDQETIVIDGSGEASLSAALQIQSGYPDDIHISDEGYTFDIILRQIASLDKLKQRIHDSGV
jgi:hypothetical protein